MYEYKTLNEYFNFFQNNYIGIADCKYMTSENVSMTLKQNPLVSDTYTVPYCTLYPSSCLLLAFNKFLYVRYIH